jgi:hypothetical protein
MRPQFAEALEKCISFSSNVYCVLICIDSKGKSAYLLKNQSKRRRSKEEVEEVKREETKLKVDR